MKLGPAELLPPDMTDSMSYLLKAGLDEVGLVDEAMFEVGEAVFFQSEGLTARDLIRVADLGEERREVVQLHHLPPQSLLNLLLLLGVTSGVCIQRGFRCSDGGSYQGGCNEGF